LHPDAAALLGAPVQVRIAIGHTGRIEQAVPANLLQSLFKAISNFDARPEFDGILVRCVHQRSPGGLLTNDGSLFCNELKYIMYFLMRKKSRKLMHSLRLTEIRRSGSFSFKALWKLVWHSPPSTVFFEGGHADTS
jgi:hypothetical protein